MKNLYEENSAREGCIGVGKCIDAQEVCVCVLLSFIKEAIDEWEVVGSVKWGLGKRVMQS